MHADGRIQQAGTSRRDQRRCPEGARRLRGCAAACATANSVHASSPWRCRLHLLAGAGYLPTNRRLRILAALEFSSQRSIHGQCHCYKVPAPRFSGRRSYSCFKSCRAFSIAHVAPITMNERARSSTAACGAEPASRISATCCCRCQEIMC